MDSSQQYIQQHTRITPPQQIIISVLNHSFFFRRSTFVSTWAKFQNEADSFDL